MAVNRVSVGGDPAGPSAPPDVPYVHAVHVAPRPIRVALADDHHLVREGLRMVLAGGVEIDVVGEASTHAEAFDLVASARPDVLLLDLTFAEGDALTLVRALRSSLPSLHVLILTMHAGPETVRQALLAGASGYLVKGATTAELLAAIRAVSRGERYLHSSVAAIVVEDSMRWLLGGPLSPREREVLSLVASGRSPAEVGGMLGISVFTVRRHLANLSEKLGLHGSAALVRYAVEQGLVRDL